MTHEEQSKIAERFRTVLEARGVPCTRQGFTFDKSILLEFNSDHRGCIDIYPSGEIIVLFTEDGIDNVLELQESDFDLAVNLIEIGTEAFQRQKTIV